jgi:hypothetical protein
MMMMISGIHRWDYVEEHNVQLPDEYDLISSDLEAFWGVSPTDLRALQSALEGHPDSWTMGKTGAYGIMLVNMSLLDNSMSTHLAAAYEMLDTLRPVQDMLPRFRAVFNPHDNPWIGKSEEFQALTRRAVEAGKCRYIPLSSSRPVLVLVHTLVLMRIPSLDLNLRKIKTESAGWLSACSKSSPARRTPFDLTQPPPLPPSTMKTFIYDHIPAMDPCLHPTILHQHGQFLSQEGGPAPIVPQLPGFSFSPSSMHADIRVATPFGWMEDVDEDGTGYDPVWEKKDEDRLVWRGRTTGIWHGRNMKYWRQSQRERMILYADANVTRRSTSTSSTSTTSITTTILVGGDKDEGLRTRMVNMSQVNEAALDMKFADEPIGCDEEDGTCEEVWRSYAFGPAMDWRAAGKYKYVMDVSARSYLSLSSGAQQSGWMSEVFTRFLSQIDGNAWSSRFKRLLTSRSLVFKATAYPEWFAQRIQPWVHYVPIQLDYSDLYDALLFFRGDETPERTGAHEELGRKIATEGRRWSKEMWRREDLTAYNFRYAYVLMVWFELF